MPVGHQAATGGSKGLRYYEDKKPYNEEEFIRDLEKHKKECQDNSMERKQSTVKKVWALFVPSSFSGELNLIGQILNELDKGKNKNYQKILELTDLGFGLGFHLKYRNEFCETLGKHRYRLAGWLREENRKKEREEETKLSMMSSEEGFAPDKVVEMKETVWTTEREQQGSNFTM